MSAEKVYTIVGPGAYQPPNYDRVVRSLSPEDLQAELELGRGEPEYLRAVAGELERRYNAAAAESPLPAAADAPEPSKRPRRP